MIFVSTFIWVLINTFLRSDSCLLSDRFFSHSVRQQHNYSSLSFSHLIYCRPSTKNIILIHLIIKSINYIHIRIDSDLNINIKWINVFVKTNWKTKCFIFLYLIYQWIASSSVNPENMVSNYELMFSKLIAYEQPMYRLIEWILFLTNDSLFADCLAVFGLTYSPN